MAIRATSTSHPAAFLFCAGWHPLSEFSNMWLTDRPGQIRILSSLFSPLSAVSVHLRGVRRDETAWVFLRMYIHDRLTMMDQRERLKSGTLVDDWLFGACQRARQAIQMPMHRPALDSKDRVRAREFRQNR